jgi:4-amino-4-deoxy-L-arabinose transferase-like glycosyltransferase
MDRHLIWQRRLLIIILTQIVAWTLLSTLSRHSLPFDTIEGIAWGNQWQLGYDKHPPLAAWLSALAYLPGWSWPIYFISQVSVTLGYWGVWKLTQKILPTTTAFVATTLLTSIWYYTLATPKFNPNTLMIPVWVWTQYAFYHAYREGKIAHWLLAGLMAGLCMLTKYESAVLLLCNFALLLFTQHGRQAFRHKGVYLAILMLFLVWSPNLYWNATHNWIELQYALGRAGDYQAVSHGLASHFYWTYSFLIQQLGTLALCLILLLIACWQKNRGGYPLTAIEKNYLNIQGLGPLLFTLGLSMLTGMYLYAKWASPYFSFLPAMVLAWFQPKISQRKAKGFYIVALILVTLSAILRASYLTWGPELRHRASADAYFPSQAISQKINQLWQQKQSKPLGIIAGSHYLVAAIHTYDKNRPTPYMDWSTEQSAWLNDAIVNQQGAMFAWWAMQTPGIPRDIQQRFPRARYLGRYHFASQATAYGENTVIDVAYLPPRF